MHNNQRPKDLMTLTERKQKRIFNTTFQPDSVPLTLLSHLVFTLTLKGDAIRNSNLRKNVAKL